MRVAVECMEREPELFPCLPHTANILAVDGRVTAQLRVAHTAVRAEVKSQPLQ